MLISILDFNEIHLLSILVQFPIPMWSVERKVNKAVDLFWFHNQLAANSTCNLHPFCSSESIHTLQSVTTNHTASPASRADKFHTGSISLVMGLCEVNNSIRLLRNALKISNQKQKYNPDK